MSKKLILVLVLALFGSTAFLRAATTDPNAELTTLTYVAPADQAQNVSGNVVLNWIADENATEYQLYFGTTYPPQLLVDWTPLTGTNCTYDVSDLIENNNHYFWQVSIRNDASTMTGDIWGFTSTLSTPFNVEATVDQLYPGDTTLIKWKAPVTGNGFTGEFTACDGTSTSSYIPVYGLWMDDFTRSEMIYPAEMLEEMMGGEINALKFYISSPADAAWAPASFQVYMMEVDEPTLTSYCNIANATLVYTGGLDGTGSEMVVEFDDPYVYQGGNLLLSFYQTVSGTWKSCSFYGITSNGSSAAGYNSSAASAASFNQQNFLPKTTFFCGNAKDERGLRGFNLFVDGQKVNDEYITENKYVLRDLAYNTNPGHQVTVTCVYDEGESAPSEPATVQVTGYGTITGTVTDIMTGEVLIGAEVTFYGTDEFDNSVSYAATTDSTGVYTMDVLVGNYSRGRASYPTYGDAFASGTVVTYEATTTVDFALHEAFNPVYKVFAEDIDGSMAKITWSLNDFESPAPGGGGGGGGGGGATLTEGFENGLPSNWTVLDANNDGLTWTVTSAIPNTWTYYAGMTLDWYRTGTNAICSGSYINGVGAITPDEYLITPQVTPANGSTFSFWAAATDASYPADHFGVAVSTTGTSASDFTMLQEWTLTGKEGGMNGGRASRDGNGAKIGTWYNYSVDLSAYAGQNIYIAIRHFNCNDQYIMCVDDIELGSSKDRSVEYYTLYRKAILKETITEDDSIVLASQMTDTLYADFSWFNAEPGLYQYGVSAVYPALPGGDKANNREELTVYDGTSTNNHVPMYVFYFDDFARSQYIIPASDLTDMADGMITSLKYYTTNSNVPYTTVSTVDFYMTEVPYTSITSYVDKSAAQVVYTGTVSFGANCEALITLDTPYQYNGGNLLIGCDNLTDAGYMNIYFYGQDVPGASISGSNSSSTAAAPANAQNFIPKTTFTFEPGAGAGNDDPVTEITWSNILPKNMETTVTVSATTNVGDYAGTNVKLENIAENYTYTATLDTANSVTFTDFRRGDYKLTVTLDGFSTNYDNTPVSIWDEAEFSAYLEELLIPVNEVLVSGTGFARWSDLLPQTDVAELYHVVCNGVFQGEITQPYMQLDVDNLTVGETYAVDVAVRYSTGLSPFTTGYFTYIGCDAVETTVEDLTGAANCMDVVLAWNGGSNPPTPPTPPTPGDVYSFEGTMDGWTTIDADGDGQNWILGSVLMAGYLIPSHDGEDCICSASYTSSTGALTPDNYLVCPVKAEYPEMNFWACAQDPSYAAEHFGVAVSTTGNTNAADFTTVAEWTMTAKTTGATGNYMSRSREGKEGTWYQKTVDLSAYAGQQIWVAIRHFNCTDMFYLDVDEVTLGGGSPTPPTPPTPGDVYSFEGTMDGWTTIDADGDGQNWILGSVLMAGYSIPSHDGDDCICSASYTSSTGALTPDNYLVCPVKAEYPQISFWACAQDPSYAAEHFGVAVSTDGNTSAADFTTVAEWTMTAKTTGATGNYMRRSRNAKEGTWYQYTVDLSDYAGQEIWVALRHFNCTDMFYLDVDEVSLGEGGNPPTPPTPPAPGDVYSFEGTMDGWTTIDADGDGQNWILGSVLMAGYSIPSHEGDDCICSASYTSSTGALTPDNYLVCPVKAEYSQINFWACAQDPSYAAEHYGVAVSTTGNTSAADFTTVAEWTMTAKTTGATGNYMSRSRNAKEGTWYQKTVDLSAYAGQEIWVAIRHFNCTDMFYLDVDEVTLATPEKRGAEGVEACGTMIVTDAASDMWDLQGTISCSSAGQQAVATDGTYIYTASWQSAPTGGSTFYKYTMDGTFVEGFNISGASEIRDLTYDGTYFYGSSGSSVLYIIDLTNKTFIGTINCAGATTRHCTYDPDQDGFWVGNWSDLYFYDRNGVKQFTAPAPSSAYGSGFFKDTDGNAHLYLFCQPNSDAKVYDYNITTNTLGSSPVCDFGSLPSYNAGIAGGAFVGNYNNLTCYFGNIQQDPNLIGIYELGAAGSGGGGAIGATTYTPNKYNILVDGVVIGATSENTFTLTAEDTAEHTYQVVYVDGNYNISCPAEVVIAAGESQAPYDLAGAYVWDDGTFGAQIEWSYGEPSEQEFGYDNGTYTGSIGEGVTDAPMWWGIMIPAADLANYSGATLNAVSCFDGYAANCTIFIHQGGTNAPGQVVYSQDIVTTGAADWVTYELDTPVEISATQNLWIIMYNIGTEYPASGCANTGDANGRWISEDGEAWYDVASFGLSYTWMIRGLINNPNGGGNLIDPTGFNVYRNNQVVTTVPYDGSVNYTYFDNVAAGNYTYKVSAVYSNTCESDYALTTDESQNYVEVNVTSVTDINDEVALYPNPTNGMVTIEAEGMNHITVVNALGQVVYNADVDTDMTQLNLGQFNAGIYMVRISTENGVGVKRVTVVR